MLKPAFQHETRIWVRRLNIVLLKTVSFRVAIFWLACARNHGFGNISSYFLSKFQKRSSALFIVLGIFLTRVFFCFGFVGMPGLETTVSTIFCIIFHTHHNGSPRNDPDSFGNILLIIFLTRLFLGFDFSVHANMLSYFCSHSPQRPSEKWSAQARQPFFSVTFSTTTFKEMTGSKLGGGGSSVRVRVNPKEQAFSLTTL